MWSFLSDFVMTFIESISGGIEGSIVSILLSHSILLFFVGSFYLMLGVIGVDPVVVLNGSAACLRRSTLLDFRFYYWILGLWDDSFDIFCIFGRAEFLIFFVFRQVGVHFVSSEVFEGGYFVAKSLHSTDLNNKWKRVKYNQHSSSLLYRKHFHADKLQLFYLLGVTIRESCC